MPNLQASQYNFRIIFLLVCALSLAGLFYQILKWELSSGIQGSVSASAGNANARSLHRKEQALVQNHQIFKNFVKYEPYSTEQQPFFVDRYFGSILNTFRNPEAYRLTSFRSGPIPKVYVVSKQPLSGPFWTESLKQFTDELCPFTCTFVDHYSPKEIYSADAVLVFLNFFKGIKSLNSMLPTRDPSQPWILFSVESPPNIHNDVVPLTAVNGTFNRTMTYRMDSDVIVSHGFIISKEDMHILPPSWLLTPRAEKTPFEARKLVVGFISHCHTRGGRMEYINKLKQHVQVDLYGACGSLKCGSSRFVAHGIDVQDDECLAIAQNYLFYLSFENSIADDYVTEKLYNALFYPVVPIVFGGANYSNILPPNSYISAMNYTPEELAKILIDLSKNETKYEEMLSWRKYYQVSTVGQRRIYCDLCTQLHQPEFFEYKVYDDLYDWFYVKSHCKTYTKDGVVPIP